MKKYEFHPIASIFPMMNDSDLNRLADDIMAKGLNHPITIFEDKILDGRNRYKACELVGYDPAVIKWETISVGFLPEQAESIGSDLQFHAARARAEKLKKHP